MGVKNNGFTILYQNMKHGQTSSKDLLDFLRESCQVEETYSKLLTKLARAASSSTHVGTFYPFWAVIKTLAEKLAVLHMNLVKTWTDLMKDIVRYAEEQQKKHKAVKEEEAPTLEVVRSIQNTTDQLHRAKELYHTRCLELERLKRENASPKDVEKSETKYKKAKEDYKNLVDKYATIREDFNKKMEESCTHFQEVEEEHISRMKDFVDTYSKALENELVLYGRAQKEFQESSDALTIQKLLKTLIESKATGPEKPGPLEFVEPDLSSLPPPHSPDPVASEKRDSISDKTKQGFLKKNKRREKKKKKKDKEDNKDSESIDTQEDTHTNAEVDEEGFTIRPQENEHNGDNKSWGYSSDSDSDSDNESSRKLRVEIKPINSDGKSTPSDNVDDIRTSVGMLRLSPTAGRKGRQTPIDKKMMKRSQSESDTLEDKKHQWNGVPSKSTDDLLGLNFFGSSASTPTGGGYNLPSPMSPMSDGAIPNSDITHSSSNLSDVFNASSDSRDDPSGLSQSKVNGSIPPPLPQRPASRTTLPQLPARPSGRNSPFMNSAPVTFNTTSMPIGSSRGPSPLTTGMSDTVPLAVAFTETINANFKGTDATKCNVKMTGILMMSFPAGVVRVFMENPNPTMLSFRIKNASRLEQVLINKQLITEDTSQSIDNSPVYQFNMLSLNEHLRNQGEQNKTASYFNVDILKYQIKASPGVESTPLPVVVYWKCEDKYTDYRLDYRLNASAMTQAATLKNITVTVGVGGGVTNMQSLPDGLWNEETNSATWKLNDISEVSENGTHGSIRAKFTVAKSRSTPSTTAIQFISEGATLSGIDFELIGQGYRISLAKKRFGTAKYLADPDPGVKYV